MQYLEQELETSDALERQNQEGLEGKALADGGALQLLQDLSETAVAVPAGQGASGTPGRAPVTIAINRHSVTPRAGIAVAVGCVYS